MMMETKEEFDEAILRGGCACILFFADWDRNKMGHNVMMHGVMSDPSFSTVHFRTMDMGTSEGEELAVDLGVSKPGTVLFFRRGKVAAPALTESDEEALRSSLTQLVRANAEFRRLVQARVDQWRQELPGDPEATAKFPNQEAREVKSGCWVPVQTIGLTRPRLVALSHALVRESLGLDPEVLQGNEDFVRLMGGDTSSFPDLVPWATPYAVSIHGKALLAPDTFGTGNGYGDGRAATLCEVAGQGGQSWELQLKGCGPTVFCRGNDGRAVLRSSLREFVASEAMFHLGVPTTRALSLVIGEEKVQRSWYSEEGMGEEAAKGQGDGDNGDGTSGMSRMMDATCAILCKSLWTQLLADDCEAPGTKGKK